MQTNAELFSQIILACHLFSPLLAAICIPLLSRGRRRRR
jgi:hypothetical protein